MFPKALHSPAERVSTQGVSHVSIIIDFDRCYRRAREPGP